MGYYKVTAIGDNLYSFFEMIGVGSNLIVGEEKALLLDTGYGYGNLRKEVQKVTSKPLIVVNTHIHVDHCLGNSQFEKVYVNAPDLPQLSGEYLQKQYALLTGYGVKMVPALRLLLLYAKFKKKPKYPTKIEVMPQNMMFDLGGRIIQFITMAGHTPGSMVALDAQSQTVFAGDAVNPGMFLFFEQDLKLLEYSKRLEVFVATKGYKWLRYSHGTKAIPFSFVGWYADFLRRVDIEKSKATDIPNEGRTVYQYTENSSEYGECSVFFAEDNL